MLPCILRFHAVILISKPHFKQIKMAGQESLVRSTQLASEFVFAEQPPSNSHFARPFPEMNGGIVDHRSGPQADAEHKPKRHVEK